MPTQNFIQSLSHAFNGMLIFFQKERNGQIHLAIAVLVLMAAFLLQINTVEWIAILLCIAIVISLEMLNSALEKLCDMVHANYHPIIKIVKDISAAAVLWSVCFSVVIGIIIFLPKIIHLL
jgi:undecaprenol kinase/diacylglycerol kinase (ATP)